MMMMMMMMMMTLMKLVNSATKFRHGMDKFYQPNSGLRGSKSRDEAIYTYTCIHMSLLIYKCYMLFWHAFSKSQFGMLLLKFSFCFTMHTADNCPNKSCISSAQSALGGKNEGRVAVEVVAAVSRLDFKQEKSD